MNYFPHQSTASVSKPTIVFPFLFYFFSLSTYHPVFYLLMKFIIEENEFIEGKNFYPIFFSLLYSHYNAWHTAGGQ